MDERRATVINASDIAKLPRGFFHGEHGAAEDDPDIFAPVAVGLSRTTPKISVRADPDGAVLNVANVRTDLTLDELEELIPALEEARDYLTTHGK